MAPRRSWCKLCQDDYKPEDVIIKCASCPKSYHRECLEQDIATSETYNVGVVRGQYDFSDFQCENCLRYVDENVIENDERCKLCKEKNRDDRDVLLLCDGCPNSYHISCLQLVAEPDGEQWFCPMCKPEDFQVIKFRRKQNPLLESGDHVNSSICYVCQRHGKLLGCDFCSNSFHHGCLPEFDAGTIGDVWECPCCRGQDPFLNQMHKRWTVQQIEKNLKERRRCIQLWKSKITKYRNRFLLAHRNDLASFVTEKRLEFLTRNLLDEGSAARKRLVNAGRDIEDILEYFEEEANTEAEKFIAKAHKSMFYPSGRRMEGRPLRAGVELKPHQEYGVDWLLKSFLTGGAILSDEMGLGKTIQTLCFLSYLKLMKIEGPHLIVVPLSTVGNWLREVHRFTPHLTSIKICGSRTERLHAMEDRLSYKGLYDLYITTYETVKNEEEFFVETVPRWQCLILDEAHRIKNQSGAARHSMDRILANMRLLLTGTPLQNNAMELFTLINFMFPDIFKDTTLLDEAFSNNPRKVGRGGSTAPAATASTTFKKEDLEAIKTLLSRVMLRRLKEEAISLQPKVFHDVWLPLSRESLHWYRTLMSVRSLMKEQISVKKLLGMVIKMRIICGHPRGIVSRAYQTEKLFDFFKQVSMPLQNKIEAEANHLRDLRHKAHTEASAKLTFLDKLLCQLHYENCEYVPGYVKLFNDHLKELEMIALHKVKLRKRMKGVSPQEPFVPETHEFVVRTPAPTARNPRFMVDGLYEVPVSNVCPYKKETLNFSSARSRARAAAEEAAKSANTSLQIDTSKGRIIEDDDDIVMKDSDRNTAPTQSTENASECVTNDHINKVKVEPTVKSEGGSGTANLMEKFVASSTKKEGNKSSVKEEPKKRDLMVEGSEDPTTSISSEPMMHKVLIFTQFQLVLDELESYCNSRGWKYMRLDGSTNKLIRELDIREFNSPSSPYFVYLISTRAGGLGINLTAANHVVLFDEDWNPFIDLQAIDRAHRIGQKRNVHIWKLISEWTVEERMALCREKKLHLDKLLINSNRQAMDYEEAAEAPIVSLTPAAILKMMMHGNQALKMTEYEDITGMYLDDLLSRGRKQPPQGLDDTIDIDESEDVAILQEEDDPNMVNVSDVMKEEDFHESEESTVVEEAEEADMPPIVIEGMNLTVSDMLNHRKLKKLLSRSKDKEELLRQLENGGFLWRSGRERRRPSSMYVPEGFRKRSESRTIRHECRCFVCGYPKNHKAHHKDKDGESVELDYGELIPCFRCPRSYHKMCESLGETKRTWTCRWHECCLCFRKSSQCDNMLIHCSNCPTSFCYDCFPPDYTRHYVGEDYYYALTQRGLNANSSNWIFFLCSKCKILQEKDRRKKMTKEEREQQQRQQHELRKQLAATDSVDDKESKKRRRENRVTFLDNFRLTEMQLENRLRTAYEHLCPSNLIQEIAKRIEAARIKKEADEAAGIVRLKREVNFYSTRLPYKWLSLCDNCKLPLHNTVRHPGECPFPREIVKLEVVVPADGHDAPDEGATPTESTAAQSGKILKKTACSKCMKALTGKMSHTRRSCDELNDEEQKEYNDRRSRVNTALDLLEGLGTSEPNGIDYAAIGNAQLKSIYATALDEMDRILLDCFARAGVNLCPNPEDPANATGGAVESVSSNVAPDSSANYVESESSTPREQTGASSPESSKRHMTSDDDSTRKRASVADSPSSSNSAVKDARLGSPKFGSSNASLSHVPSSLGSSAVADDFDIAIPKVKQAQTQQSSDTSAHDLPISVQATQHSIISGTSIPKKSAAQGDTDIRDFFSGKK
ncbi:SNF2 family N-terminal domain containing protein [Babesia divergens]|uniref:SNF2 family N-terminal domain containing protein n=1 Tax=Babesia divergens TaxID=32595 RepID=A0AAD9LEN8_BABDI|nr:SNF2 family N-terminal domain containing protein [Babesia divergens]